MERLRGIYKLFGSLVVTMEVNKEKLRKRAENSFANVTELADTLVRSEKISFRQSHRIVSSCVRALLDAKEESLDRLTWELANEKSKEILGKPLTIPKDTFYQALKPEYFIHIRSIYGGPAPDTMRNSLLQANAVTPLLENWIKDKEN
ncbi:hypothetical protein RhiirA1_486964, partial [Rhizophagus irregularis]